MDRAANIGFVSGEAPAEAEQMKEKVMGALKGHFRPEFLNRLDDIVMFETLSKEALVEIVEVQVKEIVDRLSAKRITLTVSPEVRAWLADKGYNPQYGARPLKRAVQDHILTPIATLMVGQGGMEGGTVNVTLKAGEPHFAVAKMPARAKARPKAVAQTL